MKTLRTEKLRADFSFPIFKIDAISGFAADFLRLMDVNAGGFGKKKAREFYTQR